MKTGGDPADTNEDEEGGHNTPKRWMVDDGYIVSILVH